MPESEEIGALIQELRNLRSTLEREDSGAGSSFFSKKSSDGGDQAAKASLQAKRVTEALEQTKSSFTSYAHNVRKLAESSGSTAAAMQMASKQFQQSYESLSSERIEDAATYFYNALEDSGSAYAKAIRDQIHSAEDFLAVQNKLAQGDYVDDMVKQVKELQDLYANQQITQEQLNEQLDYLGVGFEALNMNTKELTDHIEMTNEGLLDMAKATAAATQRAEGTVIPGLQSFTARLTGAAAAVGAFTSPYIDAAKSAMKTGTQLDILQAGLMGMSPEELNQLQADHRQIMQASNMTFDDFNEAVQNGASGLVTFTGSLRDAVRVNAQSTRLATLLGAEQQSFAKEQRDRFKVLHDSLSMTAEQFIELNAQLYESQGVQQRLYKLNLDQRRAYFEDLQMTRQRLQTFGLMEEQAQRVAESFAQLGAKSPQERLKEAARMRAAMGALGMGREGARLQELMLTGQTNTEEFANLMRETQLEVGDRMSRGFRSELATSALLQSAGVEQIIGPMSDSAKLQVQQGAEITTQLEKLAEQNDLGMGGMRDEVGKVVEKNEQIRSLLAGPIGTTITQILTAVAAGKLMGLGGKGAGGMRLGRAGAGAGKLAKLGSLAAVGGSAVMSVAGAGAIGWATGSAIYNAFDEQIGNFVDVAADKAGDMVDSIGEWFMGPDSAMENIADIGDMSVKTLETALESSRLGSDWWKKREDQLLEAMKENKDLSKAMMQVLKESNEIGKGIKKGVETGNEEAQDIAKEAQEENKKNTREGYKIIWTKMPRQTSM